MSRQALLAPRLTGRSRPGRALIVLSAGLAIGLLTAGCGTGNAATRSSTPAESTSGSSTIETSTSIQEAAVAVYYAVDGGFANLRRSVAIAADGSLDIDRNGVISNGELSPDQLASVHSELDRSGLFDRDREYPAPKGSADLQRYEIRYRGATLVAYDTTVPAELSQAITLLERATGQG